MDFFSSQKITNHITRIYLPGDVQAYLVEGMDKSVLIDTGCGIPLPENIKEKICSRSVAQMHFWICRMACVLILEDFILRHMPVLGIHLAPWHF